jgi:hypothetical protein
MIEFSERESQLFNLNFGRASVNSHFDEWSQILEQSRAHKLDYLRIKVVDPDSDFMEKLASINAQNYLLGIIRLYKKKVDRPGEAYFNPDIIFRKVTVEERGSFKQLIRDMYMDFPMGYFQYPELTVSFPIDLQMENISSYFSDHFSGSDATKEAYVGYLNDKPVTCFVIDTSDPRVALGLYGGVIKEYRAKNVFRDAIRYLTTISHERGIKQLITGARLENVSSQYGFSSEIGFCYGHEWVYMIRFDFNK